MAGSKAALDAMTDQSLAYARDHRAAAEPGIVRLAEEAAAIFTAQFPGQHGITSRVVMCAAQQLTGLRAQFSGAEKDLLGELADVYALAAEQLAREAPAPGGTP